MQEEWAQVARKGIDTMDPDIASWARSKIGGEHMSWVAPTSLRTLVSGFVPGGADLLQRHHNAGADAFMHIAVCRELVKEYRAERGLDASQGPQPQTGRHQ